MRRFFLFLCFFIASVSTSYAQSCQDCFVSTWNTEAIAAGDGRIRLPFHVGVYDVDVNNDGDFDDDVDKLNKTGYTSIDFGTPGEYTIAVRPSPDRNPSNQLRIATIAGLGTTPEHLLRIDKWGSIVWTSMEKAFEGAEYMTIAADAGVPNLSMVSNMEGAFSGATSFNGDLSGWDVSNVTSMTNMFLGASSFNGDLSSWDVSNVTNMTNMFLGASSFNGDLSSWEVSRVTDMTNMLAGATSFNTQNYNALLAGWARLEGLQSNVVFGAPPAFYCTEKEGRDTLIDSYSWTITGDFSCLFVTTWNTEAEDPGSTSFTLPIIGTYDIDIGNDGTFDIPNTTGPLGLNLVGVPGEYTIAIRPVGNSQLRINNADTDKTPQKLISIDNWGDIVWSSMAYAFNGCTNLTIAADAGVPNLTAVTSMEGIFGNATNFNDDLSAWDVSNVTSMGGAFHGATSFNSDLSSWDVSSVINMRRMFRSATSFNSSLKNWNVSSVDNMTDMFTSATSFTELNYGALLTKWATLTLQPNVTFGAPPANYCSGKAGRSILTSAVADGGYNWSISGDNLTNNCQFVTTWDTRLGGDNSSLTIQLPISGGAYDVDTNNDGTFDMLNMTNDTNRSQTITFASPGIHTIVVQPNVRNTTNQLRINFGGTHQPTKLKSIDKWGSIVWTSMKGAFLNCSNMNIANDAGVPDLTQVTDMSNMFEDATSFNSDINEWDVSNVTSMAKMFFTATSFSNPLDFWDVSNVTDMTSMFFRCPFKGSLENWNTSKVIDMTGMFRFSGFTGSGLNTWDVSKVTDMANMFSNNTSLTNRDLSTWDVSKVTSMSSMFSGASSFTSDLSNWVVVRVNDMSHMFSEARSFRSDISTWDVSQVTDMQGMLSNAIKFRNQDYEALLVGWSKLEDLQRNVTFTASKNYCAGVLGRRRLVEVLGWTISGDTEQCSTLRVPIKVFLQGPYNRAETSNAGGGIMNDGLREAGVIPDTPSSIGAGLPIAGDYLFDDADNSDDNIVDWVEVSLHSPSNINAVISTTYGLLHRDGDIVVAGSNGREKLKVQGIPGGYYISVNHRNHIPVVTQSTVNIRANASGGPSNNTALTDFTNDLTIVVGGSNAMAEVATGVYALFSGDVNGNNQVQVDDYNAAIQDVGRGGYLTSDVDMNGELQVSDINFILKTLGKGAQF